MWDGWKKHTDTDSGKSYELLLAKDVENSKVVVSLMAVLAKIESEPPNWKAQIITFNPGAGDYIHFDGMFSNLAEAEEKAWEKAQETVRIYYQ
jgi:hypothetical protein